ncbi:MAG: hypothetical protein IPJ88_15675 [Myxococcales bacterium]|nr:MAG: hypothetical protein IPJ88_15675 [Myxococcales bacterium]
MNEQSIELRLIELAAKRFGVAKETLSPNEDFFQQLGIDSFRAMELLSDLEHAFDVEIPDYELQGVTTFSRLAELIRKRQS